MLVNGNKVYRLVTATRHYMLVNGNKVYRLVTATRHYMLVNGNKGIQVGYINETLHARQR